MCWLQTGELSYLFSLRPGGTHHNKNQPGPCWSCSRSPLLSHGQINSQGSVKKQKQSSFKAPQTATSLSSLRRQPSVPLGHLKPLTPRRFIRLSEAFLG